MLLQAQTSDYLIELVLSGVMPIRLTPVDITGAKWRMLDPIA
jgi:hypothetical protein